MALPTDKRITQEYGWTPFARAGAYGGNIHNGMDFGVYYERWNSPALTLYILSTGWDTSGYGYLVRARDQYGYIHSFGHNSSFLVSPNQTIVLGQPHSISGNTGFSTAAHGHWGVQLPGSTGYNNYINPRSWPGFNQGGNVANVEEEKRLTNLFNQANYKLAEREYLARGVNASDAQKRKWITVHPVDEIIKGIEKEVGPLPVPGEAEKKLASIESIIHS